MKRGLYWFFSVILTLGLLLPVSAQFNLYDAGGAPHSVISATGLFTDLASKTMTAEAVPYGINSHLWLDGAREDRFIIVPAGNKLTFTENTDQYGFPDGTVFIKNVYIDSVPGEGRERLVETKFLVNKKLGAADSWHPYIFAWNITQTEAVYHPFDYWDDKPYTVQVWPDGLAGDPVSLARTYIDSGNCIECHRVGSRSILGFFTSQLNRPSLHDSSKNQLQHLFDIGLFEPVAPPPVFAQLPKWAAIDDPSASVDVRARSYLASNCSFCHGSRGLQSITSLEGIIFNVDYHTGAPAQELRNQIVKKRSSAVPEAIHIIEPGDADKSLLFYRFNIRHPDNNQIHMEQMPVHTTTFIKDTAAGNVLRSWINELTDVRRPSRKLSLSSPELSGNLLRILGDYSEKQDLTVRLTNLQGREIKLIKIKNGLYKTRHILNKGVYIVWIGTEPFKEFVF